MARYTVADFVRKLEGMRPTKPNCLQPPSGRAFKRKPLQEIFCGKAIPVTFGEVPEGQDEQTQVLYVHERLLRRSPVLRTMLDSDFKEGRERKIKLPACDLETGAKLIQWFYTGDYETRFEGEPSADAQDPKASNDLGSNAEASGLQDGDKKVPDNQVESSALTVRVDVGPSKLEQDDSWKISYSVPRFHDFLTMAQGFAHEARIMRHQQVLMIHAKMYIIADFLGLVTLQKMASKRLRAHVMWIDNGSVTEDIIEDVVDLGVYLYENTVDDSPKKIDEQVSMRKSIAIFLAEHSVAVGSDGNSKISGCGNDMVIDILQTTQKIVARMQEKNNKCEQELSALKEKEIVMTEPKPKPKPRAQRRMTSSQCSQ